MKLFRRLLIILGILTLLAGVAIVIYDLQEGVAANSSLEDFLVCARSAMVLFVLAIVVRIVFGTKGKSEESKEPEEPISSKNQVLSISSKIAVILGILALPTALVVFVFYAAMDADYDTMLGVIQFFAKTAVVLFLLAILLKIVADRSREGARIDEGLQEKDIAESRISRKSVVFLLGVLLMAAVVFLPNIEPFPEPALYDSSEGFSLPPTSTPSIPSGPARDDVLAFIEENHPETASLIEPPSDWEPLPEPSVHAFAVYGYRSATWRMNMTLFYAHLVKVDGKDLEEDTLDIQLKYLSPPPYILWWGKYAESTGVMEDGYSYHETETEKIAPEVARDLAFGFIIEEHYEVSLPDEEWRLAGVEEGVGQIKHTYKTGKWDVGVHWDEYTASYRVRAYYEYKSFTHYAKIEWEVRVSPDGENVEELYFDFFSGV